MRLIVFSLCVVVTLTSHANPLPNDTIDKEILLNERNMLMTFTGNDEIDQWRIINDGVMGGLSSAKKHISQQMLIFSGDLSTQNNGGFSSIYRELSNISDRARAIEVNVLGDGRTYQLRFRALMNGYLVAYKAEFVTTEGVITSHAFDFSDFKATFRGRLISNAPLLSAEQITSVGFLISSKTSGYFSLAVKSIRLKEQS